METELGMFDFRTRNLESADARGGILKWLVAVRCPTTSWKDEGFACDETCPPPSQQTAPLQPDRPD